MTAELFKGLRAPLKLGESTAALHELRYYDGRVWLRLYCFYCSSTVWEKQGVRYTCWNCGGMTVVADGPGAWKAVE